MTDSNASRLDRAGRTEEAARAYESAITRGEATVGDLLSLAVLYWQSTDPGVAAAESFGTDFFEQAGRRFPELLAEASRRDPVSTEVRFWRQYIAWAESGAEFGLEASQGLLREDPTVLEPARHVFALSRGERARPEAEELLRHCREEGTVRARYIASVIEGVMKRVEFQKHHGRGQ